MTARSGTSTSTTPPPGRHRQAPVGKRGSRRSSSPAVHNIHRGREHRMTSQPSGVIRLEGSSEAEAPAPPASNAAQREFVAVRQIPRKLVNTGIPGHGRSYKFVEESHTTAISAGVARKQFEPGRESVGARIAVRGPRRPRRAHQRCAPHRTGSADGHATTPARPRRSKRAAAMLSIETPASAAARSAS